MDYLAEFLSFRRMLAPWILVRLFWIGIVFSILVGIAILLKGIFSLNAVAILVSLLYLILGPLAVRIWCEMMILFFRIYDVLCDIRKSLNQGTRTNE